MAKGQTVRPTVDVSRAKWLLGISQTKLDRINEKGFSLVFGK